MSEELKEKVWRANLDLAAHKVVIFTWGNVSAIDRGSGRVAIKPSGVGYEQMKPEDIVVTDLDGNVPEGRLKPSSDTPTHLVLYRAFPEIGGIALKPPFVMQTLSDVLNKPIQVCRTDQACALGAAMFAATAVGLYPKVEDAQQAMSSGFAREYVPNPAYTAIYEELYKKYLLLGKFTETHRL